MTPRRHFELGTPSQRRGFIILLAVLMVVLAVDLMRNRLTVPVTEPAGPLAGQLADRIDPNTATESELAGIPRLGKKRAAAIVEYREEFVAAHPGQEAFSRLSDLQHVKGIGPATAELMGPSLIFPGSAGTSNK